MVDLFSKKEYYMLDGGLGTEIEKVCPDILVSDKNPSVFHHMIVM